MRALTLMMVVAFVALLGIPATVSAGGWAVTTLDQVPEEPRAGETYQIGYTIRQHGETPVGIEMIQTTEIKIQGGDGSTHTFPGHPEGTVGHYVAEVNFPVSDEWTWSVNQGIFGDQDLGTIAVSPPPAMFGNDLLRIVLPVAALLAVILVAVQGRALLRTRSSQPAPDAG